MAKTTEFEENQEVLDMSNKTDNEVLHEETFLSHSWNILESDEYLRKINEQYYLYIDNGSYCIEVDSNELAADISLYRDIEPRKVNVFEEYGEWQKLDTTALSLKHTHDSSFQEKYIGIFDHTIDRFLVDTVALKIVDHEVFWRPENNQPDKFKVIGNQLVDASSHSIVIPKRKSYLRTIIFTVTVNLLWKYF